MPALFMRSSKGSLAILCRCVNCDFILKVLLHVTLALFVTSADLRAEDESNASTNDIYKIQSHDGFIRFLNQPYPVRVVQYVEPGEETSFKGKPLTGKILSEGAIQPNTYYLRRGLPYSNSPAHYVMANTISGLSADGIYWHINAQALLGKGGWLQFAKANDLPQSGGLSIGDEHSKSARFELETILHWGIRNLVAGSVVQDGDDLVAKINLDPEFGNARTNYYPIRINVTDWNGSVPKRLVITSSAALFSREIRMVEFVYEYKRQREPVWFPTKIVGVATLVMGRKMPMIDREIPEIEFGLTDLADGYKPNQFMTNKTKNTPILVIVSNDIPFQVKGKTVQRMVASKLLNVRQGPRLFWSAFLFVIITFLWLWSRSLRKTKNGSKTTKNE